MKPIKFFSMFSGIGGFEYGMELSDYEFECVGYSEIDDYAKEIYRRHYPNHINYGDATRIRTEELPDFDFLIGGFPCQSFSIAGNRKGLDDSRGTLFFEIARILKDKKPRYFLLENVRNLLSHDKGNTFKVIVRVLTELGYCISWKIHNSRNHGTPQNRERIFIIGCLEDGRGKLPGLLFKREYETKEDDRRVKNGWIQVDENHKCTVTKKGDFFAVTTRFRCRPFKKKQDNYVLDDVGLRKLSPCECEFLQGFPKGYTQYNCWGENVSDMRRYKCVGNAVTTFVIRDIINEVFEDYEEVEE